MRLSLGILVGAAALLLSPFMSIAVEPAKTLTEKPASLKYLPTQAYHIPPETTIEESGYFSLCEGKNGKIYVGTAGYGRNSYLVEFDPQTQKMRIVLDCHKLVGLPLTPTGYAAQSKIHTRNFVGPSGKIYVGTKQGYPTAAEKAEEKKTGKKIATYRGGYVIVYDPATDKSVNLGMPMPLNDKRQPAGAKEGEGVIDVAADEERGLIYVVTCENQHWMLYDTKHPQLGYVDLATKMPGPNPKLAMKDQPNTLIGNHGIAAAITEDYKVARYNPSTDKVTVDELLVEGKPFRDVVGKGAMHPDWRLAADGKTAYLQLLNDTRLFHVDLGSPTGQPVLAHSLGERFPGGKNPDSRGSISIAKDGRVYSTIGVTNETGYGTGLLHHLVRFDPKTKQMSDLGIYAIKNPDFFNFKKDPQDKNEDGSLRPRHGYHKLPDGTMTPLHVVMATIVAHDGTVYATTIYPFTLMKVPAIP